MPEHYDLTLLDPDNKLGRDIAIMRADIEELHVKLARIPVVIARAALGIIFCTAAIVTFLNWCVLGANGSRLIPWACAQLGHRHSDRPADKGNPS